MKNGLPKDDPPWTRKELSIRVGYVELAQAVVEQWKKDGQPDAELIPFWIDIIKAAQAEKNKEVTHEIPLS